jgi:outer membrane protein assembly factor BamA
MPHQPPHQHDLTCPSSTQAEFSLLPAASRWRRAALMACLIVPIYGQPAAAQTTPSPASSTPAKVDDPSANPKKVSGDMVTLNGRRVEQIKVLGNSSVSTSIILNVVRTREGEPLDSETVEEDYQRIFGLRKFANVEASVEPTTTGGVIVVFRVNEQRTVASVAFVGNIALSTRRLQEVVDIQSGESIDRFRISLARQAIERLYRDRNFPFASVAVDEEKLTQTGELVFIVTEGPNVRIRRISFRGAESFEKGRLMREIQARSWVFILRNGRLDFEQLDDDVAALRRFYESKGYFDVRVGRRIIFSADQREANIDFVVDEGRRYVVKTIAFEGVKEVDTNKLLGEFRLAQGDYYDRELIERDMKQIVRAYSPLGRIYQPGSPDPDFLRINDRILFKPEAGEVELTYDVAEGKPFNLGQILVRGNPKTMDKLVLREMRMAPGQLYNSAEVTDAMGRIRNSSYYAEATPTPIGEDPATRDLLVEVRERQTATFNVGAGINSNGGIAGNITYEQRNFDIGNLPKSFGDFFSDRAFTGAGQRLRISFEPGTEVNNLSVLFSEPALFDQPYSLTTEAYIRNRIRDHYDEDRIGARASISRRFAFINTVSLQLRGEIVDISDVEDPPIRAPEIVDLEGSNPITSVALGFRRDTTDRGFVPTKGYTFNITTEQAGAMGGDFDFNKVSASWDSYYAVFEDLLERKTVLSFHVDSGYIFGDAPFFERFYAGGIGSMRGFAFRGISPRSGLDNDAVGGDFILVASNELSYPLAGDVVRGVIFNDFGTVEQTFNIDDFRGAVGVGVRITFPFFGGAPLALDFAQPYSSNSDDDEQFISFSFGFTN